MATFPISWALFIVCFAISGTMDLVVLGCAPCNAGWVEFGNRCHLIVNERESFEDAEAHCQGLSRPGRPAHLMSINSQKEQDFLEEYVKSIDGLGTRMWIGLQRNADPEWLDGSQDSYRNWAPSEPNGGTDIPCGNMDIPGYGWADRICTKEYSFVCEMPPRFTKK